ncbi:MAG: EVE domain-containing protein [Proteobacteria bacterium]|nr:MAG: EVE domain-containing protein [Pseudomonadota bacterium]
MANTVNYWLMKSEPDAFSIDDLAAQPRKTDHWDGIRNYQARNFMRDDMKKGDLAFFYHSNCDEPGIVGVMEVVSEAYPDHTAFDPGSKYFDPKSDPENPRWMMVDMRYRRKLRRPVSLKELKSHPELSDMVVCRKGSRLSITPVTAREWDLVMALAGAARR